MTYSQLINYAGDVVAASSAGLLIYRSYAQKIFLVWCPKPGGKWAQTFWTVMDKLEQTFEIIALNSHSREAKDSIDFKQAAKQVLPAECVEEIKETVQREKIEK